jgi:uncharacterized integral membrane protein
MRALLLVAREAAEKVTFRDLARRPTDMDPESQPEQREHAPESRGDSLRRHARRTGLYAWAGALVALLVTLIALAVANTRTVEVSWVFGSTRQSLVWIILATAILGWLLGIATSVIFRFRTRRRVSARGREKAPVAPEPREESSRQ